MDIRVIKDIGFIIVLKRDIEGVGVGHEGNGHHQADDQEMEFGNRPSFLDKR